MLAPELYIRNGFRITGLSVEATPTEVKRHISKAYLAFELGVPPTLKLGPLQPPPEADAWHEAEQRLMDPLRRIEDELFWFWPHELGSAADDPALVALAQRDVEGAVRAWQEQESGRSVAGVSAHNLAVLYHCQALDLELLSTPTAPGQSGVEKLHAHWAEAYRRWEQLVAQDSFWDRLRARIERIADPRLRDQTANDLRKNLPVDLLGINATLAVRAAEAGDLPTARRHLETMRASRFAEAHQGEVLRKAVAPVRERVATLCKMTNEEIAKDPAHADRAGRQLLDTGRPLLTVTDTLLRGERAIGDAVHDEVAVTAATCANKHFEKTKDLRSYVEIMQRAESIASSEAVRAQISSALKGAKDALVYVTCWFCQRAAAADAAHVEVTLRKEVGRSYNSVRYSQGTLKVPRCGACKQAHGEANSAKIIGNVVGGAVGVVAGLIFSAGFLVVVILGGVGIAIGGGIGKVIADRKSQSGERPLSACDSFPGIKQKLGEGWTIVSRK